MTSPVVIAATFDADVWAEEVERLRERSPARQAAKRARRQIDRQGGVERRALRFCEESGPDGTRLGSCMKVYVPLDGPPSGQPCGFVFELVEHPGGPVALRLLAYGERHPRRGTRSVYARAHKLLHGQYPER